MRISHLILSAILLTLIGCGGNPEPTTNNKNPPKKQSPVAKAIKSGDKAKVLSGLKKLDKKGLKEPDLCLVVEATLSKDEKVRGKALDIIQKNKPEWMEPLLTLLTSDEPNDIRKALLFHIKRMGPQAKCLSCVIVLKIYEQKKLLKKGDGTSLIGSSVPNGRIKDCFEALVSINPHGEQVIETAISFAELHEDKLSYQGFMVANAFLILEKQSTNPDSDVRKQVIGKIISALKAIPDDPEIPSAVAATKAVGSFGNEALQALPVLKKLRLHSEKQIRDAAVKSISQIES